MVSRGIEIILNLTPPRIMESLSGIHPMDAMIIASEEIRNRFPEPIPSIRFHSLSNDNRFMGLHGLPHTVGPDYPTLEACNRIHARRLVIIDSTNIQTSIG